MTFVEKLLLIYGWAVRTATFFLPEIPLCQRFRGWLYSFAMKKSGGVFKVSANVILNRLEKLEVGRNVYFANGCIVAGGGDITIGDNVLFGPNVVISAENHKFDGCSFVNGYVFGRVTIGNNVWIGANSSILMGTIIPNSSVVGAGSVCNKPFEKEFAMYAGAPAVFIKNIDLPNRE